MPLAGPLCLEAHGTEEVRKTAAVEIGKRSPEYKKELCEHYLQGNTCPEGHMCSNAHSKKDLRLKAVIQDQFR